MSDSDAYDDRTEVRDRDDEYDRTDDYDARGVDTNPGERGKWISALVALLGLWLVVEPFLFEMTAVNFWNDIIVGLALIALGAYNYYRRADQRLGSVAVGVFVALLGLWLLAAPFVFGVDGGASEATGATFWNDVVVGALVVILGAYSAYEARDTDVAHPART
jgi:ABC-type nickel/cobalt efflux system permease component RcnA